MGFIQPDAEEWKRSARRVLVYGPPDSGKTHSLATWPRPVHIVSYPGEKGVSSIPQAEGIKAYVWQMTPEERADSNAVINAVRKLTVDILSGKYGEVKTFAGDGLHKLCDYFLDTATAGHYLKGEDFELKLYNRCYAAFKDYLTLVLSSNVPYVVFTAWTGKEGDEYKGQKTEWYNGRMYPDLPGKLAKQVTGEFTVRLMAKLEESLVPNRPPKATWVLRQDSQTGSVGIKLPPEHPQWGKLPQTIPQDWPTLEKLLLGEKAA
jgi:AAA domain-containing protein